MEIENNVKLAFGATIGYAITAIFNAILVVLKETYEGIHDWLANVFGHHWIGHGILTLLVFVIFTIIGMFIYKGEEFNEKTSNLMIMIIVVSTLLSVLIIAGFFIMHL